jgi:hypothetical protein
MQSTMQPVSQCPNQTTLVDRVANRPIFPRTSHFSAISPASLLWPIYAPQCIMSHFSPWTVSHNLKVMQKSTVSFRSSILSVIKTEILIRKGDNYKTYFLACMIALELTHSNMQLKKCSEAETPRPLLHRGGRV